MGSLLLYDPLIMGHHLVYAENFTDWGLSRGLKVFFCGYHYQGSLYHQRYADNPDVEFLDLDEGLFSHRADFAGLLKEHGEIAFHYDRIRPLLFDDDGPAIQAEFVKSLQRKIRPDLTLLLYGDEMWTQWEDMARRGDRFETPTWLWLLYAAGHYYDPDGLHSRDIRPFLKEQKLFRAVATTDEYQAARHDPGEGPLCYVPDPYRSLSGPGGDASGGELPGKYEALERFLERDGGPVLLVPGLLESRKNADWLLEAVRTDPGLSLVALGRKNLPGDVDERAEELFKRLAGDGRFFSLFSYVPERFLVRAMDSPRVSMLPLPYRRHDLSSGIQLMALWRGLPCLVPDNGLMARRALENGVGSVFTHESAASFFREFPEGMAAGREVFGPACEAFTAHFSREAFHAGADRLFGLAGAGEKDPLVQAAARHDSELLRREPEGRHESAWFLQKALLLRALNRREDSLACLARAAGADGQATRPVYLKALVLEEGGRAREGLPLLNGLIAGRQDHPDVAAWIDAWSDTVVKRTPSGDARVNILASLKADCGEGPLFPALVEVLSDRVWYQIHRGRHELAGGILEDILRVVPGHALTRFIQAMNLFIRAMGWRRDGRASEAEAALEEVDSKLGALLEAEPDNLEWLKTRASLWAQQGRHDDAAAAFGDIARNRGDAGAYLNLSDVLRYAGRYDEAAAAAREAFTLGACTQGVLDMKLARIRAELQAGNV